MENLQALVQLMDVAQPPLYVTLFVQTVLSEHELYISTTCQKYEVSA